MDSETLICVALYGFGVILGLAPLLLHIGSLVKLRLKHRLMEHFSTRYVICCYKNSDKKYLKIVRNSFYFPVKIEFTRYTGLAFTTNKRWLAKAVKKFLNGINGYELYVCSIKYSDIYFVFGSRITSISRDDRRKINRFVQRKIIGGKKTV